MEIIDRGAWPREGHYRFFAPMSQPFYSLTFPVDVTALRVYVKERRLSFYPAMVYQVTRAMDDVEAFRLRDRNGTIVRHDQLVPSFTDLKPGSELFHIVTLPAGDGFSFCRQLRRLSRTPVIFLTVLDDEDSIVQGLSCGGDDYVTKPFSARVLLSRMQALLRRTAGESVQCLCSGELVLQPDTHTALLRGEALPLMPKEWEILLLFLQNPGRLLTRRILLERLWDAEGSFVDDNTLSVHMSRLRKKLGDYQGTPYIRTERGFGYRWEVPYEKR